MQLHGVPSKNLVVMPAHSGIKLSLRFKMPSYVIYGKYELENKKDFEALTNGDICFNAA